MEIRVNLLRLTTVAFEFDKRPFSAVPRPRTMNREQTRGVLGRGLRIARTLHILKSRDVCAPFRYEIRPSRPDNRLSVRIYLDRVRLHFGIGLYCYRRPRKPVQSFCLDGRRVNYFATRWEKTSRRFRSRDKRESCTNSFSPPSREDRAKPSPPLHFENRLNHLRRFEKKEARKEERKTVFFGSLFPVSRCSN